MKVKNLRFSKWRCSMLVALLAVLTCIQGLVATTSVHAQKNEETIVNERLPFSYEAFNPCTQQMVLVSGIQHIVIKTAVVNGATHSTAHVTFKGSGVADDGTLYQVQITDTINGPRSFGLPETFPTRFTVESSFRLIGQGENNNFVTKFSEHITFNPDGRITSEFFRTGEECR